MNLQGVNMYTYNANKKTCLSVLLMLTLLIFCVGCDKKEQATEEEKKEIIKTCSIVTDEALSETEIDKLVAVLSDRVSYYDIKGKVSLSGEDENGNPFIEISVAYGTDEAVFETLTCQGKLQFISGYGTEKEEIWLGNDNINTVEAKIVQDLYTEYIVQIVFDKVGSEKFEECTTELTGEQLYIVYDGEVLLSPTISEPVTDGVVVINNLKSFEDAEEFAMTLGSGCLDYKLESIE